MSTKNTTTKTTEAIDIVKDISAKLEQSKVEREAMVLQLQTQRQTLVGQLEEVEKLLTDLGHPVVKTPPTPTVTPMEGKKRGPRTGNSLTIAQGVEKLLMDNKEGLSRPQITRKMIEDLGWTVEEGEEALAKFSGNVYTGGINKLQKEKKIVATGQRPNTIYKHASYVK